MTHPESTGPEATGPEATGPEATGSEMTSGAGTATRPNPMRGFRGICAATLAMEAVMVGLALLVVDRLGPGLASVGGWYTVGLALALLIATFLQRRPWGLGLALVLQAAMVGGWFVHPALGVTGLLFVAVWVYLLYVRREVLQRYEQFDGLHGAPNPAR